MFKPKKLKYENQHPEYPSLQPSKKYIPQWYKDTPRFTKDPDFWNQKTYKLCSPFLDALSNGYMMTLPGVIRVTQDNGFPLFNWEDSKYSFMDIRPSTVLSPPTIPGYVNSFVWRMPLSLEIPKGYSVLFTHPLNRFDLPFITLSGIVDDFKMHGGSLPFLMRADFEGILEAGTPIAQLIPFKRENWESKVSPGLYKETTVNNWRSRLVRSGWYKNNVWQKKTYE